MPVTLPGATDSACVATNSREGTRWVAALIVVSSTEGFSRPLMRTSRDSAVMRCATTAACGETRSYGRQSQAGNCSTSSSGAKNESCRASAAIREPSRQITTALVAGALARAATALARSAITKPSAPSATLASVSGRSGASSSAGDLATGDLAIRNGLEVKLAHPAEHRRVLIGRNLADAGHPGQQVRLQRIEQMFELVE